MSEHFRAGPIGDVVVRDLRKFLDSRGWLVVIFRCDELEQQFYPTMAHISSSSAG